MRPGRATELLLDGDHPAIWFLGVAMLLLSLLGGIGIVAASVGPSWSEICSEKGGHYEHDKSWDKHGNRKTDVEKCVPAEER